MYVLFKSDEISKENFVGASNAFREFLPLIKENYTLYAVPKNELELNNKTEFKKLEELLENKLSKKLDIKNPCPLTEKERLEAKNMYNSPTRRRTDIVKAIQYIGNTIGNVLYNPEDVFYDFVAH